MQRVYTAANLPEAYLVLHLLRQEGIDARVLNEHAQGGLGEIPFASALPQVWVTDEAWVERARAAIGRYERTATGGPARHCSACGEDSPATFETCWHCGRALAVDPA